MNNNQNTSAAAISAQLRRLGFQPFGSSTRRTREGLRVTESGGRVRVCADLNDDREALELAIVARRALIGAGYAIVPTDEPTAFYVSKRTSDDAEHVVARADELNVESGADADVALETARREDAYGLIPRTSSSSSPPARKWTATISVAGQEFPAPFDEHSDTLARTKTLAVAEAHRLIREEYGSDSCVTLYKQLSGDAEPVRDRTVYVYRDDDGSIRNQQN